jgi:redox-sensitive bicupin YhaK (pirin superfamily)
MSVKQIIRPRKKDLGGFFVRRLLPQSGQSMVGPWIFFDHMGPANFPVGTGIDVRPHPHINLATVTYLFEGEVLHRDSLGNAQIIRPGDINLMVSGKGITHSERETEDVRNTDHCLHGLQLWLALPEEHEETEPAFYHHPSESIPALTVDDVPIRVLIGSAYSATSPVMTYVNTLYIEAHLQAGQNLVLPPAKERALYIASGSVRIEDVSIEQHNMAVLTDDLIGITAIRDSRIAMIGGENPGDRFILWNFVSSRKERIQQAKEDWQAGLFPKVPGDEDEFIPFPE